MDAEGSARSLRICERSQGGARPQPRTLWDHLAVTCEKRHSFLNFSYVCPEPVLVKRSFIYIMAQNVAFVAPIGMSARDGWWARSHFRICLW